MRNSYIPNCMFMSLEKVVTISSNCLAMYKFLANNLRSSTKNKWFRIVLLLDIDLDPIVYPSHFSSRPNYLHPGHGHNYPHFEAKPSSCLPYWNTTLYVFQYIRSARCRILIFGYVQEVEG